jgi:hypothetical protein
VLLHWPGESILEARPNPEGNDTWPRPFRTGDDRFALPCLPRQEKVGLAVMLVWPKTGISPSVETNPRDQINIYTLEQP